MAQNHIDPRRNGHRRIAVLQTTACQMQGDEAARTGRVDRNTGPLHIEEVGYAVGGHGAGLAGVGALVDGNALGVTQQEIGIICVEAADETGCLASCDFAEGDSGCACESLPLGTEGGLPFSNPSYVTSRSRRCWGSMA